MSVVRHVRSGAGAVGSLSTLLLLPMLLAGCGGELTDPVAEPECLTLSPGPLIRNQSELNALAGVCYIFGNLAVKHGEGSVADPIVDLSPLTQLRRVSGVVLIEETNLTAIDLAIDSIRGQVDIRGNPLLTSLRVEFGQLEVDGAGNGIRVEANPALAAIEIVVQAGIPVVKLTELPALRALTVDVRDGEAAQVAIERTGLVTITGFALQRVGWVEGALTGVYINDNPALANIDALSGLAEVRNYLFITDNPALCVPAWANGIDGLVGSTIRNNNTDC